MVDVLAFDLRGDGNAYGISCGIVAVLDSCGLQSDQELIDKEGRYGERAVCPAGTYCRAFLTGVGRGRRSMLAQRTSGCILVDGIGMKMVIIPD